MSDQKSFKVTFTLDPKDAGYFRNLYRTARKHVTDDDRDRILAAVKELITRVRSTERAPRFVLDAIIDLEDLMKMIEDVDYDVPKPVAQGVLATLAYFANPQDVIPDHVPALGFLDDAIMIKLVEDEFKHELWGYRQFRKFRAGAEQRPWTGVAKSRLPERLREKRAELRAKIRARERKVSGRKSGW